MTPRLPSTAIPVYTQCVDVVKVRRVGNSSVITIPKDLESTGFAIDSKVVIEELASGQLLVTPEVLMRQRVRSIGRAVIAEDFEALEILRTHDPNS